MFRVRSILYPTDFSSFSTAAYMHAVGLAETTKAALTILYVFRDDKHGASAAELAYWKDQLDKVRPSNPAIPVTHVLQVGDPAAQIVRYAAEAGTDVIVMGTHGRTGEDRLLMGSVAERVMRDAPCSVLVVKMPRSSQPAEPLTVGAASY
jgi:nucleotide-binding universal stress UspA family protein